MKIIYDISKSRYAFDLIDDFEKVKSNFLLTNTKGDFLNLGIVKNSSKFFGLNVFDNKTNQIFKILDEIVLENIEVEKVIYSGNKVKRIFSSKLIENSNSSNIISDSFYLGPTGGFIYEIKNYIGNLNIDLDARAQFDFDKWGRNYKVYKEKDLIIIEYTKKSNDKKSYTLFLAIKTFNYSYDLIENWYEKTYSYSKIRNTDFKLYVFRALKIKINNDKKIFFGASVDKKEAISQIDLLEKHQLELENFDREIFNDLTKENKFETPLNSNINLAYKLSNNAIYNFYNKNLDLNEDKNGFFAGFPWFSKIWSRDELFGLRAFINNSEFSIVKTRLFYYLNSIDKDSGLIKRIDEKNSLSSADSVFLLAKRFEDLIYHLEKKNIINKVFSIKEIKEIYFKLNLSFKKIVSIQWDKENELIKVKNGDSWMDTISAQFPLDIQIQFLNFTSVLSQIAVILGYKDDANYFLDFENGFRENIRSKYLRNNQLYNEAFSDDLRSNVFLAYYYYPDLFLKKDWEIIFDNSLKYLKTNWGGISSLSNKDDRFLENYSGEKNESYHNGDSWYFINNICAIALNDLNEKKYRNTIREILISSTNDILKLGCIGFSSEISSASKQKSEGCFAQFWSSSTYLEMIDSLFKRF